MKTMAFLCAENLSQVDKLCFPPVPPSAGPSFVPAGSAQSPSLRFQSEGSLLNFPSSYNLNTTLSENCTVMWLNCACPGFPVCGIA